MGWWFWMIKLLKSLQQTDYKQLDLRITRWCPHISFRCITDWLIHPQISSDWSRYWCARRSLVGLDSFSLGRVEKYREEFKKELRIFLWVDYKYNFLISDFFNYLIMPVMLIMLDYSSTNSWIVVCSNNKVEQKKKGWCCHVISWCHWQIYSHRYLQRSVTLQFQSLSVTWVTTLLIYKRNN